MMVTCRDGDLVIHCMWAEGMGKEGLRYNSQASGLSDQVDWSLSYRVK